MQRLGLSPTATNLINELIIMLIMVVFKELRIKQTSLLPVSPELAAALSRYIRPPFDNRMSSVVVHSGTSVCRNFETLLIHTTSSFSVLP